MVRLPPPPPRAAIRPAGQAAASDPSNPWAMLAVVFGGLAIYEAIKYGLRKA